MYLDDSLDQLTCWMDAPTERENYSKHKKKQNENKQTYELVDVGTVS